MPYFIGDILELPLTTTQDYSLFHILGSYSTTLWKEEVESILARNGLVSFIIHPDYLIERRARADLCRAAAPPQRASGRKERLVCRSGRREPLVA